MSNIDQLYLEQQDDDEDVIYNISNDVLVQKLNNFRQSYFNIENQNNIEEYAHRSWGVNHYADNIWSIKK